MKHFEENVPSEGVQSVIAARPAHHACTHAKFSQRAGASPVV